MVGAPSGGGCNSQCLLTSVSEGRHRGGNGHQNLVEETENGGPECPLEHTARCGPVGENISSSSYYYVYRSDLQDAESQRTCAEQLMVHSRESRGDDRPILHLREQRSEQTANTDATFESRLSKETLRVKQTEDTVINTVREWIEIPSLAPSESDLRTLDPDVQDLYAQRQTLESRDGVLYRKFVRPDGTLEFNQVVVTCSLRAEFIDAVHSGACNGHLGVQKTQQRLKEIAYWKGWVLDVQLYVGRCHVCCRFRHGPRRRQGEMKKALGCTVMQKIHCDLTGPHVTSRHGYKYLLTVICSFTKYLITVPIRDKTSLTVAKALMRHVYLVYGTPEILVHDQGGEFWSDVMTDLAKLLGIQVSKITSHRPSSNGVIERIHSTLHSIYAKVISVNQRNWCELTPYVAHAYNTAYHASTTFSPFYLMFMRRPRGVVELQIDAPTEAAPESEEQYVNEVSDRMRTTYALVREQLRCGFDRAKKRYDARVKAARFSEGDLV